MDDLEGVMHLGLKLSKSSWHYPKNRAELEVALEAGCLYLVIGPGLCYLLRRNGNTQTWKTRRDDFRIPCMYGLRGHYPISHETPMVKLHIARTRQDAEMGS